MRLYDSLVIKVKIHNENIQKIFFFLLLMYKYECCNCKLVQPSTRMCPKRTVLRSYKNQYPSFQFEAESICGNCLVFGIKIDKTWVVCLHLFSDEAFSSTFKTYVTYVTFWLTEVGVKTFVRYFWPGSCSPIVLLLLHG